MFERFKRTGNGSTAVAERPVGRGNGATARMPAPVDREQMHAVRARQREEYGGINWGAAFFGWLVAVGLGALLGGILAATGAAIGLTEDTGVSTSDADTLSIAGAIALLVVLAIAYYCGGYVAGRMSRFDGTRQGIGVWIVGILVTIALAVLAIVAGSEYNVLEQVNLPSLPIDEQSFATGGLIATVAALVVTLLAAALGGKAGERFHRKIDRTAVVD
jgi:hypothetical protein